MQTNTLTFPTLLPALAPRPADRQRGPRISSLLKDLKARKAASAREARHFEKRLRKTAERGQRIVLGSADQPFDPLVLGGAPLAALRRFEDLEIAVTTRSPEILEQLDLLIELDQRHTVAVDMLIATGDPGSPDLRERLKAVSTLAAEGITTRLVATGLPDLVTGRQQAESWTRKLFEAAWESRAYDVTAAGQATAWSNLFRRLRLELGFPRPLPGRG